MTNVGKFNKESFAKRVGRLSGKFMSIAIEQGEMALDAMEAFGNGNANAGISFAAKAIKAKVQKLERSLSIPYALEARELSALEEFNSGVKAGFAEHRNKKPQAAARSTLNAPRPKAP